MRGHLYNCFETGRLAPFPFQPRKVSISRKVIRTKRRIFFHETCIKVNAAALKTVRKWKCMDCNNVILMHDSMIL